jgi:hypothetical protein
MMAKVVATETSPTVVQFRRPIDVDAAMLRRSTPQRIEPEVIDWNLPGFGGKARVGTAFGDLPIEALRLRDDIRTFTGSIARVQWVDKIHLDADFLRKHPSALPIRIAANSLGPGKPMQDLIVSPRQEVCPDAHVASSFLQASDLRPRFDVHRVQTAGLTYYRFHCGEPVVVRMEGVWVRILP